MKFLLLALLALFTLTAPLLSQVQPVVVTVTGTPAAHTVRWNTNPGFSYELKSSLDLQTWNTACEMTPGTGGMMEAGCTAQNPPTRLYYRVHQCHYGWLTRPQPAEKPYREDGVIFAFDLMQPTAANVTKICLSKRRPGGSWQLIGTLTDIATLKSIKTVQGPSVWIPASGEVGNWEVKAEGKNGTTTLCTATRLIEIVANSPPQVTVTGYTLVPPGPTSALPRITFLTDAFDGDAGDTVSRVEYYDNGLLIGADHVGPRNSFGNATSSEDAAFGLVSLQGSHTFLPNQLLPGGHPITAKAYDTRGGAGETPPSPGYSTFVSGLQYRPRVTVEGEGTYDIKGPGNQILLRDCDAALDAGGSSLLSRIRVRTTLPPAGEPPGSVYEFDVWLNEFGDGDINFNTTSWIPGLHTLSVFSRAQTNPFGYHYSYPRFIHVLVNSTAYVNAGAMAGQLTTASAAVVPGSPVKFFGPYAASQPYTSGTAAGLDASAPLAQRVMNTGVVLTTGLFSTWNANDQADNSTKVWETPGDDLIHDRLARAFTRDASALEFDVTCTNGQLEMELQFGSEEYPELIGDPAGLSYDAFGVTVDGTLISLVPDGGAPISSESIHPAIPKSATVWPNNLETEHPALREHLYLHDDTDISAAAGPSNQVDYDGMSVRLRLHAFVTPGVHKIRISIADTEFPYAVSVQKGSYDSAAFIRGGSIRTIAPTP